MDSTVEKILDENFREIIDQSAQRRFKDISLATKDYLARMLTSFASPEKLFKEYHFGSVSSYGLEPITFQLANCLESESTSVHASRLRNLGDHCLFLTGYLYDFVRKRGKSQVEFHYQVGSTAYLQLGRSSQNNLFTELGDRFVNLSTLIGDLHLPQLEGKKLFDLYEQWLETKDERYASLLLAKNFTLTDKKIV